MSIFLKNIKKTLALLILAGIPFLSFGQIMSLEVGVDGLTCSACTRATEMGIRKLDFVDSVAMDLSHTNGKIYLKKGAKVSMEQVAKAVVDAGFSVRYLNAVFNFDAVSVTENLCWTYEGEQYQFVKAENKTLTGNAALKFVGEKYLPRKEYKKWASVLKDAKGKGCNATYYVTL